MRVFNKDFFSIILKKTVVLASVLAFLPASSFAVISFGNLDLDGDNNLLYSITHDFVGESSYTSLFKTHLSGPEVEAESTLLTVYPDRMELLDNGKLLEIRNRYGTALYSTVDDRLTWKNVDSSIPDGYSSNSAYSISPDGSWICYVNQKSNAKGELVLKNVISDKEKVLNEDTAFYLDHVNVKWAADSRNALYELNGCVYFITPEAVFKNVQLPDSYCSIGKGTINSVQWTKYGQIVYIDGDIIYLIDEKELYTRGLYSSLLGGGKIIGRLPNNFNPYTDRFWINDAAQQIVVANDEKVVSRFSIKDYSYNFIDFNNMYSLTAIDGSILDYDVFWSGDGNPLLWVNFISYKTGRRTGRLYSLSDKLKIVFEVKNPHMPVLSQSKRYFAFSSESTLYVYDARTLKRVSKIGGEKVLNFVWNGDSGLYVGTDETIKYYQLVSSGTLTESKLICLSSVKDAFWSLDKIIARTSDASSFYVFNEGSNTWYESIQNSIKPTQSKNSSFRVYLDSSKNMSFSNAIYVRSVTEKTFTYPLHDQTQKKERSERRVAIVFDALNNAEGLPSILNTLEKFNIKSTFFINGEFMRRYPEETRQIVSEGHACASMFYADADLVDGDFLIDRNFIEKGLARNEDEFYSITGKELTLYWHAPYYKSNEIIRNAGTEAGYRYVDLKVNVDDRNSIEDYSRKEGVYYDVDSLIDNYIDNLHDGMIISVSVGNVNGTRDSYLYEKVDLLIAAILNKGYKIVNINEL